MLVWIRPSDSGSLVSLLGWFRTTLPHACSCSVFLRPVLGTGTCLQLRYQWFDALWVFSVGMRSKRNYQFFN